MIFLKLLKTAIYCWVRHLKNTFQTTCVGKVPGLVSRKRHLESKIQTTVFPSELLESFPWSLTSHLLCHACKLSCQDFPRPSTALASSTPSNQAPLMTSLSSWRRKKSYRPMCSEWESCFSTAMLFSIRNSRMPRAAWSRRIVTVNQPQVVLPQLSPLLALWMKQTLLYLFVDMFIDRLALLQQLVLCDPLHVKECNQQDFDIDRLSGFLRP